MLDDVLLLIDEWCDAVEGLAHLKQDVDLNLCVGKNAGPVLLFESRVLLQLTHKPGVFRWCLCEVINDQLVRVVERVFRSSILLCRVRNNQIIFLLLHVVDFSKLISVV